MSFTEIPSKTSPKLMTVLQDVFFGEITDDQYNMLVDNGYIPKGLIPEASRKIAEQQPESTPKSPPAKASKKVPKGRKPKVRRRVVSANPYVRPADESESRVVVLKAKSSRNKVEIGRASVTDDGMWEAVQFGVGLRIIQKTKQPTMASIERWLRALPGVKIIEVLKEEVK